MLRTIGVIDKIKVGDVAGAMQKAALKWAALPEGPGLANHYPPQPYAEYSKFLASYRAAEEREMRSLITTAASAGCCFATSAALADGAQKGTQRGRAGIAEGEALLPARAKLLKQGWRPTRRHSSDGYEYSGAELQLTGHKIFEVDSCSMDSSRCILYYSKKGKCLRMDSIGEQLRDMTVTRGADECPDAPPKASAVAPD